MHQLAAAVGKRAQKELTTQNKVAPTKDSSPWWKLSPQKVLRWGGAVLKQTESAISKTTGKLLGYAGLILEEGSTEKIMGMIAGGVIGGGVGSLYGGPIGALVGGIGGGMLGGKIGESLDPYEGSFPTTYEELQGMEQSAPDWWYRG
jgi:hypothetical protein